MAEKFESVVMYGSWLEVARNQLNEDDVCKLMVQLMEYGLYGTIPQNDDAIMNVIFMMAKPNIDSNIRKKLSGRKGGRPKNKGNAKTSGLSNGNGNANGNVNANGNANDNESPSTSPSCPSTGAEGSVSEKPPDWMEDDYHA